MEGANPVVYVNSKTSVKLLYFNVSSLLPKQIILESFTVSFHQVLFAL